MFIDFKEIPVFTDKGTPTDNWESFCQEFLEKNGYKIIKKSSNGPDGGLDMIVEKRDDKLKTLHLVSCKHNAHSSKSVGVRDEHSILDRLEEHGCGGFVGFYSTKLTTTLQNRLDSLSEKYGIDIFTPIEIESTIIGNSRLTQIFGRYFPISQQKWKSQASFREPVKLLTYYMEKENLNIRQTLEWLFGDMEGLIYFLRSDIPATEWLVEKGFIIYTIPDLWRILDGTYVFKSSKNSWEQTEGLWRMTGRNQFYRAIPAEVEEKYRIRLPAKVPGNQAWTAGYGLFIDYKLFVVMDELLYSQLDKMVEPLREILST